MIMMLGGGQEALVPRLRGRRHPRQLRLGGHRLLRQEDPEEMQDPGGDQAAHPVPLCGWRSLEIQGEEVQLL